MKYDVPKIDILRLQAQLKKAKLPITNVRIAKDLTIDYDWLAIPTEIQFQQAAEIIEVHDPKDMSITPDVGVETRLASLEERTSEIKR